ncbi:hypothetical protein [Cellulomonas sp. HD19AZ1]|uniref:hypothetical protein n=1 Tax=Cellulomonas iranensis TaxID=76862 RepID=UPI0010715BF9|nr:hypothetical protein E4A51_08365 [Cellulomonas sp. HD19AZ1]
MLYATSGSPQTVSAHGSTARSYGNWSATRVSSTQLTSLLTTAYYRYNDADNHTVYVTMNSAAPNSFSMNVHSSHDNVVSGSWSSFRSRPSASLHPTPITQRARVEAAVKTCLDVPLLPDACSGSSATLAVTV